MTSDLHTATEDMPLEDVMQLMERQNVKRLPVVRGDVLVGIVTRSDLLRAVASLARDVPDPTADDDHIRERVIASSRRKNGARCISASRYAMESYTSVASSQMSVSGRRRLWRPRASLA
jgi:CBS-domain-containing membrane protein